MFEPVLIIHGGAGSEFKEPGRRSRIRKKIKNILAKAYAKLLKTSALEAAVYAVQLLEDDPDFNAGTGSMLQADGRARLSASVMDGKDLRFAGVINVEKICNPVLIAKNLLSEKDRVLDGAGALCYAKKSGFKTFDVRTPKSIQRWKEMKQKGSDTVGACTLDSSGNLASATSTGGRGFEFPGRVSDSGMPIANYANHKCAVCATGIGEEIMDQGLAVKIATRVLDGSSLASAFDRTFKEIKAAGHRIGAVGIDYRGRIAFATTTACLTYGWRKGKKEEMF